MGRRDRGDPQSSLDGDGSGVKAEELDTIRYIIIIIIITIIVIIIIIVIVILPFQRWTESPLPRTEPQSHGAFPPTGLTPVTG